MKLLACCFSLICLYDRNTKVFYSHLLEEIKTEDLALKKAIELIDKDIVDQ